MNIFETTVEHFHHHDQEKPVPSQQQPQRLVDSLHAITGEIASNPLIARLAEHGLGKMLSQQEADHFAALIASLEQGRATRYAQLPDAPHDGTQQQPVQQ